MNQRNTVWVVEMLADCYRSRPPRWESTVAVGLTKRDAERKMREWRSKNGSDEFRVKCYYRGAPR